jgi:hypothetical protein
VTKPTRLLLGFFDDFPALKILKKATRRMVIGIKKSIKLPFIRIIPKTDSNTAKV